MKSRSLLISLFCFSVLAGCSDAPSDAIDAKLALTPAVPGQGHLVIYRDKMPYMGTSARIDINQQRVVELWQGEAYVTNIPPGKNEISVGSWSSPDHYSIKLTAIPNTTYTFKIAPRTANMSLDNVPDGVDYRVLENGGVFTMALKDTDKD